MSNEIYKELFVNDGSFISTILFHSQILSGKPSDEKQNLGVPSIDPFIVPDLDDLYKREKLRKGSSGQLNDIGHNKCTIHLKRD